MSTLGVAGERQPSECTIPDGSANLVPQISPVLATGLPGQS